MRTSDSQEGARQNTPKHQWHGHSRLILDTFDRFAIKIYDVLPTRSVVRVRFALSNLFQASDIVQRLALMWR